MKTIVLSLLICCGSLLVGSKETVICEFDWNKDGKSDQFIFYQFHSEYCPADFVKLSVHLSRKGDFVFTDPDSGWVKYSNEACYAPLSIVNSKNLLNCDYAALLPVLCKGKSGSFIVFI